MSRGVVRQAIVRSRCSTKASVEGERKDRVVIRLATVTLGAATKDRSGMPGRAASRADTMGRGTKG